VSSWNAGAEPQGGACVSCAIHTALLIEYSGTDNKAGAGAAVAFLFLFITFFAPGVDVSEYTPDRSCPSRRLTHSELCVRHRDLPDVYESPRFVCHDRDVLLFRCAVCVRVIDRRRRNWLQVQPR